MIDTAKNAACAAFFKAFLQKARFEALEKGWNMN